jgi:hypothetical protein
MQPIRQPWAVDLKYSLTTIILTEYRRMIFLSRLFVGTIELLDESHTKILIIDKQVINILNNGSSEYKRIFKTPSSLYNALAEYTILSVLFNVILRKNILFNVSDFLDVYVYRKSEHIGLYIAIQQMLKRIEPKINTIFTEYVNTYNKELRFNTLILKKDLHGEDKLYNLLEKEDQEDILEYMKNSNEYDSLYNKLIKVKNKEITKKQFTKSLTDREKEIYKQIRETLSKNEKKLNLKNDIKEIKKKVKHKDKKDKTVIIEGEITKEYNPDMPDNEITERIDYLDSHPKSKTYPMKINNEDVIVTSRATNTKNAIKAAKAKYEYNLDKILKDIDEKDIKIRIGSSSTTLPRHITRDIVIKGIAKHNGDFKEFFYTLLEGRGRQPLIRGIINDMKKDEEGYKLLKESNIPKKFYKGKRQNRLMRAGWNRNYRKIFEKDDFFKAVEKYYESKIKDISNIDVIKEVLRYKKDTELLEELDKLNDEELMTLNEEHTPLGKYLLDTDKDTILDDIRNIKEMVDISESETSESVFGGELFK